MRIALTNRHIRIIKNDILGKNYSLSVAYVSAAKSRALNKKYRKKDRATNVLSFSLRKNEGELVLCKDIIKKEAKREVKQSGRNFEEWLQFLVIHGMLHLKGMEHGSTMERAETFYDQKYNSGNRRRVRENESRGRRISARKYSGRKNS